MNYLCDTCLPKISVRSVDVQLEIRYFFHASRKNLQSKELQMGTITSFWVCGPVKNTLCFITTSCLLNIPLTPVVQPLSTFPADVYVVANL